MKKCLLLAVLSVCCRGQWFPVSSLEDGTPTLAVARYPEVMEALCPGQAYHRDGMWGCEVCPVGMAKGQKVESRVQSAIPGHFSAPGSDDVLLVLRDCEPHANHFINVLLFTRKNGRWTFTESGGPSGFCRKIANRDGREGLLCYDGDTFNAVNQAVLSFQYVGGGGAALLSTVNVYGPCFPLYGLDVVADSVIDGLRITPQPGGGAKLSVKASCSRGRKACKGEEDISQRVGREYQIDFEFDGMTLHVSKASEAALKEYSACANLFQK